MKADISETIKGRELGSQI